MPSQNSPCKLKASHERSHQQSYIGQLYIWRASLHILSLAYIRLSQNDSKSVTKLQRIVCTTMSFDPTYIYISMYIYIYARGKQHSTYIQIGHHPNAVQTVNTTWWNMDTRARALVPSTHLVNFLHTHPGRRLFRLWHRLWQQTIGARPKSQMHPMGNDIWRIRESRLPHTTPPPETSTANPTESLALGQATAIWS